MTDSVGTRTPRASREEARVGLTHPGHHPAYLARRTLQQLCYPVGEVYLGGTVPLPEKKPAKKLALSAA